MNRSFFVALPLVAAACAPLGAASGDASAAGGGHRVNLVLEAGGSVEVDGPV